MELFASLEVVGDLVAVAAFSAAAVQATAAVAELLLALEHHQELQTAQVVLEILEVATGFAAEVLASSFAAAVVAAAVAAASEVAVHAAVKLLGETVAVALEQAAV